MRRTRLAQSLKHRQHSVPRKVQLPPQFPDEVHPQSPHPLTTRHINHLRRQPRKVVVRQGSVRQLSENVARARSRDHKRPECRSDVLQRHARRRRALRQIVPVKTLRRPRRHHIKLVRPEARHRKLASHAARVRQRVTQRHSAVLRRNAIGEKSVHPRLGVRPAYQKF